MADIILSKAVKGLAGGIGLASEGISHYKQKKAARKNASQANDPTSLSPSGVDDHPDEKEQPKVDTKELPHIQNDEEHWDLDDAQDEQVPPASSNQPPAKPERDVHKITANFIARYPPPQYVSLEDTPKLPFPVLLPQRRPKDRARGFIRAYAPVLAECGIDQAMFLEFLETFNQASQASPWINAINLAGFATMALPMGIGIAVQAAITIAVKAATEVHSRHRTHTFLDTINDQFFRPRGLFCLVMTWNPESDATETAVDLSSTISATIQQRSTPSSGMSKLKNNLKRSDGNTYGELDFPEVAPLIFPALDELQETTSEEATGKREKLKRTKKFVSEYWDRRAQAEYAGQNPNSVLSQGPKPSFASRYADPNHPANSGHLLSLITGGYINPPSLRDIGGGLGGFGGRGAVGRGSGGGIGGLGQGRAAYYGGYGGGLGGGLAGGLTALSPITGVKKLLTGKVLYLMIVNIPSDDEFAAAQRTVTEFQQAAADQQAY